MYIPMITFSIVNTTVEKRFVQSCLKSTEYRDYILNSPSFKGDELIIYSNKKMIGIFNPNVSDKTGVKVATPSLYLVIRMSKSTGLVLGEIIYHLFVEQEVELIRLPVYSNNNNVVRMLKRFGIKLDGVFKMGEKINGKTTDLFFFSIRYEEFKKLKEIFQNEYIK